MTLSEYFMSLPKRAQLPEITPKKYIVDGRSQLPNLKYETREEGISQIPSKEIDNRDEPLSQKPMLTEKVLDIEGRTQLPGKHSPVEEDMSQLPSIFIEDRYTPRSQLPQELNTDHIYKQTASSKITPLVTKPFINTPSSRRTPEEDRFYMTLLNAKLQVLCDLARFNSVSYSKADSEEIRQRSEKIIYYSSRIRELDAENIKNTDLYTNGFNGGTTYEVHTSLASDSMGTGLNLKSGGSITKGKLTDNKPKSDGSPSDKELLRKMKLRTYWKMHPSESTLNVSQTVKLHTSSISDAYRKKLNDRLFGVTSDKKGNFLSGYGLSPSEYRELMTNDDLGIASINGASYIENTELNRSAYGMPAKIDVIISTGRFSKGASTESSVQSYNNALLDLSAAVKTNIIFNVSSFGAEPTRVPFYRRQLISLGTEVTYSNLFIDASRLSKNAFNFNYINVSDGNSVATSRGAHWYKKKNGKVVASSQNTPINVLNNRFPDFMKNMYTAIFYARDLTRDDGSNYLPEEFSKKDDNSHYSYFFDHNLYKARVTGIDVPVPAIESNTVIVAGRKIQVPGAMVSLNHTATLKLRLDENLELLKMAYELAGYDYSGELSPNEASNIIRNGFKKIRYDIWVHYELVNSFIPLKNTDDPSTPFSKDKVEYRRDKSGDNYGRIFIFKDVRILGIESSPSLSNSGETAEISIPFTFLEVKEELWGHALGDI